MKIRNKRSKEELQVVKNKPKGWHVNEGTLTQPVGTVWISNGKFFVRTKNGTLKKNPNYKDKLLIQDEELFKDRIKSRTSNFEIVPSTKKAKTTKTNKKSTIPTKTAKKTAAEKPKSAKQTKAAKTSAKSKKK